MVICAGCHFSEEQNESAARYCRDCGKPYVHYLGEGLTPIYAESGRTELTVVNDHTLTFIVAAPEFSEANIMPTPQVSNGTVPPGARQTVRFSFNELPPWCLGQESPVEIPLTIRAGSQSGEPCYQWKFTLICSEEPTLELALKSQVIRLCTYSPVKLDLDLTCRKGFAIIEGVRVGGQMALDLRAAPLTLMGPGGQATIPLTVAPRIAAELEEQSPAAIELICRGLPPREYPFQVVKGYDRDYLLRTERWTDQGYRRAFPDAQPVDRAAGWEIWVDRKEIARKTVHFAMEKEQIDSPPDLRRGCKIEILKLSVPLPGVSVDPEGPIQIAQGNERTKTLIIDPSRLNTVESSLRIDFHLHPNKSMPQEVPLRINVFDAGPYPCHLGLDFGTSNSCVALIKPARRGDAWGVSRFPQHVQNLALDIFSPRFDPQVMPTVIDLNSPITYEGIGDLAKRRGPKGLKKEFKRLLNDPDPKERDRGIELSTKFIHELLRRVQCYLLDQGAPFYQPVKVMMTVPTAFNRRERAALQACCRQALVERGVDRPEVELIDESLAALKYYINLDEEMKRELPGMDLIMVLDCGGGTTDITVVENVQARFEPIISGGDPEFGGKEVTYWLEQFFRSDPRHDPYFVDIADQAKRSLADKPAWDRFLATYPDHRPPQLDYDEILSHVKTQLQKDLHRILWDTVFYLARRLRSDSGAQPKKLLVCLAGGSANLVGFAEVVAKTLERLFVEFELERRVELVKVLIGDEPKKCVSQGAFISANLGSIGIGQGQDFSSFRVVVPVDSGVELHGLDSLMVKVRPVVEGRNPMSRVAVLLHANLPFPTPEHLIPTFTLQDNFGVSANGLTPLNLCTQYGSGTPRPIYDPDKVPLISCNQPFRVYLDKEGEVNVELRSAN